MKSWQTKMQDEYIGGASGGTNCRNQLLGGAPANW